MKSLQAFIHILSIPFKLTFTHAMAKRSDCDSVIVELRDGEYRGFGEAVLREYVNGPEASSEDLHILARRVGEIIEILWGPDMQACSFASLKEAVLNRTWKRGDLPLLSAVEGAMLDIFCQREGKDIYSLIAEEPLRTEIVYGGVVPILPIEALTMMVRNYLHHGIPYIRLKLSQNIEQNREILTAVRDTAGMDYDIRVDVNGAWKLEDAVGHLELLRKYRIMLVEEPLGPDPQAMKRLAGRSEGTGVSYVADESAVTLADIDRVIEDGSFSMINIRLAKNGGLLRSLAIAGMAEEAGLKYQLGCHVGETGISSVKGRIAASLMPNPIYIDGSFDDYILADNITRRSYTFGPKGSAGVIRGEGIGYQVDQDKLQTYSRDILPIP